MSDEKETKQQEESSCVVCKTQASASELDANSGLCCDCWSEYYNH